MSENPFTDGQQFSAARLNSMYNAHQNEGVLNGLDVSTSVNAFDVDVASGELFLNDDVVSVGSATLSLSTSDPEDRVDLISADSTGLTVTQGNPAATSGQPIAPDIPSGDVLVSLIYVRGGSSEILTGDIFNNYRVSVDFTPPDFISPQGENSGLNADTVRGKTVTVDDVNGKTGSVTLSTDVSSNGWTQIDSFNVDGSYSNSYAAQGNVGSHILVDMSEGGVDTLGFGGRNVTSGTPGETSIFIPADETAFLETRPSFSGTDEDSAGDVYRLDTNISIV